MKLYTASYSTIVFHSLSRLYTHWFADHLMASWHLVLNRSPLASPKLDSLAFSMVKENNDNYTCTTTLPLCNTSSCSYIMWLASYT